MPAGLGTYDCAQKGCQPNLGKDDVAVWQVASSRMHMHMHLQA